MKCFHVSKRNFEITFSLWKHEIFSFFPPLNSDLALTGYSTYTINGSNQPPPRHQFLSSHSSHFPERFQGIIALTNHPLGSGAHEIDVPSFQNNGGALWGASWCHNFSSWQAAQVYFGPRIGTGPMKTQSGQLNQSPYRGGWWCKQPPDMLNHILCTEQTDCSAQSHRIPWNYHKLLTPHYVVVARNVWKFHVATTENNANVKSTRRWRSIRSDYSSQLDKKKTIYYLGQKLNIWTAFGFYNSIQYSRVRYQLKLPRFCYRDYILHMVK